MAAASGPGPEQTVKSMTVALRVADAAGNCIFAWQPQGGSSRRYDHSLLRGPQQLLVSLVWAHVQLAHTRWVPACHRWCTRQHGTADTGWGQARDQHQGTPAGTLQSLCQSNLRAHQTQRSAADRIRGQQRMCGSHVEHLGAALTPAQPLIDWCWLHTYIVASA